MPDETRASHLQMAVEADIDDLNRVIERAIQTWDLPDRVKRLSLASHLYRPHDLAVMEIVVAKDRNDRIIGVAAWEPAHPADCPDGRKALLLHGVYVDPDWHRGGVGSRLLTAATEAARVDGYDGVVVRAQREAVPFYVARGMVHVPATDPARDYPHRYWIGVASDAS